MLKRIKRVYLIERKPPHRHNWQPTTSDQYRLCQECGQVIEAKELTFGNATKQPRKAKAAPEGQMSLWEG